MAVFDKSDKNNTRFQVGTSAWPSGPDYLPAFYTSISMPILPLTLAVANFSSAF
jgi:hypothetical protein